MIPVHRPYLGQEELEAVARVFASRWLGRGSVTEEFEGKLRDFLGVSHVIAMNTGTAALHMALDALDLRTGDEVIVPSLTFPSTVQAILAVGALPVFCDVQLETLNMDISDALNRVTGRTRTIVPVHYGGVACEMDELLARSRERSLRVVEDAAHAFGSSYKGRRIGSISDVTCFSFDPIKNITCGSGGCICTDDDLIAGRILPRHNVGIETPSWSRIHEERHWYYRVVARGYRYHLSNFNAAIGLEQLKRLESFRERKQAIVRRYDESFKELEGLALVERNLPETFPFSYVVRVLDGQRDALMRHLKGKGIGCTVEFIPNHLQPAFADFRTRLPVTERLYGEVLTLPLYFEMTDADVETVIETVYGFFDTVRRSPSGWSD